MAPRAGSPAAASAAARSAASDASAPQRLAFTLELTPEFVDAVATAVMLRLGADEHQQQQDEWLTADEAAAHLRVPKSRIYRRVSQRAIPHVKEQGRLFFSRTELDGWRRSEGKL